MMLEVRETYRITLEERVAQFGGIKRESLNGNQSTNYYKAQTVNKTGMGWDAMGGSVITVFYHQSLSLAE